MEYILDGLRNSSTNIVTARFAIAHKKTPVDDYIDIPIERSLANHLRLGDRYTIKIEPAQ